MGEAMVCFGEVNLERGVASDGRFVSGGDAGKGWPKTWTCTEGKWLSSGTVGCGDLLVDGPQPIFPLCCQFLYFRLINPIGHSSRWQWVNWRFFDEFLLGLANL